MEEQMIMAADAEDGWLELFEAKIKLKYKKGFISFFDHGLKDTDEIPLKNISGISFRKAGKIVPGDIRFIVEGTIFIDRPNLTFTLEQQPAFEKIKEAIESKLNSIKQGEEESSYIEELEKLAKLKEKGIISEGEFNAKKKQILDL